MFESTFWPRDGADESRFKRSADDIGRPVKKMVNAGEVLAFIVAVDLRLYTQWHK